MLNFKKTNEQIPRIVGYTCTDGRTYERTENHGFIEPLLSGSKKLSIIQVGKYLFKVNNKDTRTRSLGDDLMSLLSTSNKYFLNGTFLGRKYLTVIIKEEYKLQLTSVTINLRYSSFL